MKKLSNPDGAAPGVIRGAVMQPPTPSMKPPSPVPPMPTPTSNSMAMNKAATYRFKIAAGDVEEPPPSVNPRHVAIGGTLGLATALPALYEATKGYMDARIAPDVHAMDYFAAPAKKGLTRAALAAALVASYPYLKNQFGKMFHGVKPEDGEKTGFNRSTIYRRKFGPKEFHIEYPKGFNVGGVESQYDYGYLPGVRSPDGDSADFYVGDDPKGVISRFTKTLPGQKGLADYKYFVGLTPQQMEDYQKRFSEYTHSPGAALVDRKDFKDWNELEGYLAQQPRTGLLTRLQEGIAAERAPMKVATFQSKTATDTKGLRALLNKFHAARAKHVTVPFSKSLRRWAGDSLAKKLVALPVDVAVPTMLHPLQAGEQVIKNLKDPILSTPTKVLETALVAPGLALGYAPYAYGAYRGGKYLYNKAKGQGEEVLHLTPEQQNAAELASAISDRLI